MALLVLHYHEMWLKGGNRNFFLHKLTDSLRSHLAGLGAVKIEHEDGRVLLGIEGDPAAAVERLRRAAARRLGSSVRDGVEIYRPRRRGAARSYGPPCA